MVDAMLDAGDITVLDQIVSSLAKKFGRHFANDIRERSAGSLSDK
jgi:putative transposase